MFGFGAVKACWGARVPGGVGLGPGVTNLKALNPKHEIKGGLVSDTQGFFFEPIQQSYEGPR